MKLLVVVDMQRDFVDGALGTPEAVRIVPVVRDRLETRRREGWTVVFTRDTHDSNYLQTQEGTHLPVLHCLKGSFGWEIVPELPVRDSLVFDIPAFGSLTLADYAASLPELREIELVGLRTDICVLTNALILKTRLPEVPVVVDASCCAGVTPESHKNALSALRMCQIQIR